MKKIINILLICSISISIFVLVYSGYNIIIWNISNKEISKQLKELDKEIKIEKNSSNEEKDEEISIDFTNLKSINKDTKGWLYVNGTNINYPIVQGKDNKYYLKHQFNKKKNSAGWIFIDYRNNEIGIDNNTVIYGHDRLNKTMFGSLKDVIKPSWYGNSDNHIVKIFTEKGSSLWQVFSTYKIPTTNDYTKIKFADESEYMDFITMLKKRSIYDYGVELNSKDKIITLSTCYKNNYRTVLHAKLIKKSN